MKVSGSLLAMLPMLAVLLASACGDGGQPAATPASTEEPADATPSPTAAARIAFTSDRDGNGEIYVVNADGSGLTRLFSEELPGVLSRPVATPPVWSPDGLRIAFTSFRELKHHVRVVNADASGLSNLGEGFAPAWAPDGSRITFSSNREGDFDIYVMNADGSGVIRLTTSLAKETLPAWSPDGSRIAFVSFQEGNVEVYVVNANGSGQIRVFIQPRLGPGSRDDASVPVWSPDSTQVAFTTFRDVQFHTHIVNADGSGISSIGVGLGPVWSPDGSRIAFTIGAAPAYGHDDSEIYVVNVNGSGQTRLTNNPAEDLAPAWSPDGTRIAFVSDRDGNDEIYVMNADGSSLTNLTNSPSDDRSPAWAPAQE